MNMKKKGILIVIILSVCIAAAFWYCKSEKKVSEEPIADPGTYSYYYTTPKEFTQPTENNSDGSIYFYEK